jgi:hypothetical protein
MWRALLTPPSPTRFSALVARAIAAALALANAAIIVRALTLYHAFAIHVPPTARSPWLMGAPSSRSSGTCAWAWNRWSNTGWRRGCGPR